MPDRAHPHARLVFEEMRRQGVTYGEIEHRSGILISTIKAWRNQTGAPGMASIEAALGALGWTLVPVPRPDTLPEQVREQLEEFGQHFRSDEEALGAAIAAAAAWPAVAVAKVADMASERGRAA
jgi:hypothetical protein